MFVMALGWATKPLDSSMQGSHQRSQPPSTTSSLPSLRPILSALPQKPNLKNKVLSSKSQLQVLIHWQLLFSLLSLSVLATTWRDCQDICNPSQYDWAEKDMKLPMSCKEFASNCLRKEKNKRHSLWMLMEMQDDFAYCCDDEQPPPPPPPPQAQPSTK